MRATKILATLGLIALAGCGKEMGRVRFGSDGTSDATMTLKAGEVDFWTDIDVAYQGSASLTYAITLEQGGNSVATATCNPLGRIHVKSTWVETDLGSSHTRRGMGKMVCSADLPSGGSTTVKATLAWGSKPASATLKKADLVVKQ
jgi:hypothetical protein